MWRLLVDLISALESRLNRSRDGRRRKRLSETGMYIGHDVRLPVSTAIDTSYCHLIRIEDGCVFGEECFILAHDAQMDEYLDAARVGRIHIREGCHIGLRTVILPGVDVGPRTVVLANSVVSRSLPPDSVCGGSPAVVIGSLDEYLAREREQLARRGVVVPRDGAGERSGLDERLLKATADGIGYVAAGETG